jgi:glucose-1-phosphate thymidylyltransferase
VVDPERYGVVDFDMEGRALSIKEKPERPKPSYSVTGLCFFAPEVDEIARSVKPSSRDCGSTPSSR